MRSIFNALMGRVSGKKSNNLARYTRRHGKVPLSWAGSTSTMDYLNVGDALSAVMVALLSGRDIERVPSKSQSLRMACVGTIGHGFAGGEVWFWGTGASLWENPSAPMEDRRLFSVAGETGFTVTATRGPYSEKLLTGKAEGSVGVYGDPVWLLPASTTLHRSRSGSLASSSISRSFPTATRKPMSSRSMCATASPSIYATISILSTP